MTDRRFPAVTIRNPWALLIVRGLKTVEFRKRRAPRSLIGKMVAIHAGMAVDWPGNWLSVAYAAKFLNSERLQFEIDAKVTAGHVVGICRFVDSAPMTELDATIPGCPPRELWPKYCGWWVRCERELPTPIPARGQVTVPWWLPDDVAEAVRGQLLGVDRGRVKVDEEPLEDWFERLRTMR